MAKKFPNIFSMLNTKTEEPSNDQSEQPLLKLIFFITERDRADDLINILDHEKVRMHFTVNANGTASSEVLNMLGLVASEKAVTFCLEQEILMPVLMREVQKEFGLHNPGAGIAFTVPLSGINSPILRTYKKSVYKNEKIAKTGDYMLNETKNDLIIAVINQGYSDEFMNTARKAGAAGGTIIHARGQAHDGVVKFFGISVQEEREIVLILTSSEQKVPIMRAVSEAHGLNSEAHGIIISVPVDNVLGMN